MGSGALVPRMYSGFRGVDFRSDEADPTRSPDAVNMWKDYRSKDAISTRPTVELIADFNGTTDFGLYSDPIIYGIFFYNEQMLVHCERKLFKIENGETTEIYSGMGERRSQSFIHGSTLYIKDGLNYLQYDGNEVTSVVGYIPTTSIGGRPSKDGLPGGGSTPHEDVNLLTPYRRNTFIGDGESNEFYLDCDIELIPHWGPGKPSDIPLSIKVNGTDFDTSKVTIDYEKNAIVFNENIPPAPFTDGQDNVEITFAPRTADPNWWKIANCTMLQVFDNRVFFSGNPDYPNTVWHSSLNDPTYCSDLDYYNEGLDLSPVRGLVAGNDALWVFKAPSQANTAVFYHKPALDDEYGKVYPSEHSSIAIGCVGSAINFNDDIVFFSDRGMEGISGDITTEQVLAHRSTLINQKLIKEKNYEDMILVEFQGYLLVIIDDKIYLADSRAMTTIENHMEYEWFYWEMGKTITCATVNSDELYLGTSYQVYKMIFKDDRTEVTLTKETTELGSVEYRLYGETIQKGEPAFAAKRAELVNTYKAGKYKAHIDGTWVMFDLEEDLRSTPAAADYIRIYADPNQGFCAKYVKQILQMPLLEQGWIESRYWTGEDDETYAGKGWFNRDYGSYDFLPVAVMSDYFRPSENVWEEGGIGIAPVPDGSGDYALWIGKSSYYYDIDNLPGIIKNYKPEVYYVKKTADSNDTNMYHDNLTSHWTTPLDKFDHPHYLKTSNKRGCTVEAKGDITVHARTNRTEWEHISDFKNVMDYFVCRIKRKKFKDIQLRFSTEKGFSLESATLECFVGGYIKR